MLLVATLLVVLLTPIVMPIRMGWMLVTRQRITAIADYLVTMAIGMDQFGGSVLYGTEDFTISAWTYKLAEMDGHKSARYLRWFIDLVFGRNHCENAYYNEVVAMDSWHTELAKMKGEQS